MARILVTPRSLTAQPHWAVERLREAGHEIVYAAAGSLPDEAELLRLVAGVSGWLAGVEPVSPAVIAAAGKLRAISRNGVGVDNLPLEHLAERGITLCTADGANAAGVAELAIALMLAALRRIPQADAGIKAGGWPRLKGREIRGRVVGVVGCGAIGGEAARLAAALGASVIAFDPLRPRLDIPEGRLAYVELPDLFADAEIVSLNCPPPPDGRPLVDAAMLGRMRPDAILVNTARASLIDEAAVIMALDQDRLAAYAADVFAEEPPQNLALAGHPRVIATSHIGGFTDESVDRATILAIERLMKALAER
jgi:D-3-phosphoglycerate dehydrogenase